MTSLFTTFAARVQVAVFVAGILILGAGSALAQGGKMPTEQVNRPQGDPQRYSGGDARRVATPILKFEATSVPIYDSNAMLNLEYNQIRSAPLAPTAKKETSNAVRTVKAVTVADLEGQLAQARVEYKGAKLAYTQAVRSKDKTRVAQAKATRNTIAQTIKRLKQQIATQKAADKAAGVERHNAAARKTAGGEARTSGAAASK